MPGEGEKRACQEVPFAALACVIYALRVCGLSGSHGTQMEEQT